MKVDSAHRDADYLQPAYEGEPVMHVQSVDTETMMAERWIYRGPAMPPMEDSVPFDSFLWTGGLDLLEAREYDDSTFGVPIVVEVDDEAAEERR